MRIAPPAVNYRSVAASFALLAFYSGIIPGWTWVPQNRTFGINEAVFIGLVPFLSPNNSVIVLKELKALASTKLVGVRAKLAGVRALSSFRAKKKSGIAVPFTPALRR